MAFNTKENTLGLIVYIIFFHEKSKGDTMFIQCVHTPYNTSERLCTTRLADTMFDIVVVSNLRHSWNVCGVM